MKDGKKLVKKCLEKQKASNFYNKLHQKQNDFARQSKKTNDSMRKFVKTEIAQKANQQKEVRSNLNRKNNTINLQTDIYQKKQVKHNLSDNHKALNHDQHSKSMKQGTLKQRKQFYEQYEIEKGYNVFQPVKSIHRPDQSRRFTNYEELIKGYQKNHRYEEQELESPKLKQYKSSQSLKISQQRYQSPLNILQSPLNILQKLNNESSLELKYFLHKKRNHEQNRTAQISQKQQKRVTEKSNDPIVQKTDKMRFSQAKRKNDSKLDDQSFKRTQFQNIVKELAQKEKQMENMYMELQQKYKYILKSTKNDLQKHEENKVLLQRLKCQHFQNQQQLEKLTLLITRCQSSQLNTQAESYQSFQQSKKSLKNCKYSYVKVGGYGKNISKIPVSTQTQTLKADFEQIKRKYLNYQIQHEGNGQIASSSHENNKKQHFKSQRKSIELSHCDPFKQIEQDPRMTDIHQKENSNKLECCNQSSKQNLHKSHQQEFIKPPSYPQLLIKNFQRQSQDSSSVDKFYSQKSQIRSKPKCQDGLSNQKLNLYVSKKEEQSSPAFKDSGSQHKQQIKKAKSAFRQSLCKLDPEEINYENQQFIAQSKPSYQASPGNMSESMEKTGCLSEKDMFALRRDLFGCKSTEMDSKNNQRGTTNKQSLNKFRKQYKNQLQQSKIVPSNKNFHSSKYQQMKQAKDLFVYNENGLEVRKDQLKRDGTQQHRFLRNQKLNKQETQIGQIKKVQYLPSRQRKHFEIQQKDSPCEYRKINPAYKKNGKHEANDDHKQEGDDNNQKEGENQQENYLIKVGQMQKQSPQTPINKFNQRKPNSPSSQLNKYRFKPSLKIP